jgi:two-component system CheB/CheR fusion protein
MALAAPVGTDRSGTILVVEDVPELRELLARLLGDAGHRVVVAPDGLEAVELVTRGVIHPELILADYNLPNGLNGLQLVARLRKTLNQEIPVIILTGDISTDTLRAIARQGCVQLNKPVKLAEMLQTIQRLLALPQAAATPHPGDAAEAVSLAAIHPATIHIVDDDRDVRRAMRAVLEQAGRTVEDYASCEAFLDRYRPGGAACLVVDAYLPGMPGLELLRWLGEAGHALPSIMMTGSSDVPMAVEAMKAGASDFIEKPVLRRELLASIDRALEQSRDSGKLSAWHAAAAGQVASLTPRQREIMDRVLAGEPSKNIAADLGISQRTVENHRASIMKRTGVKSLPALARLALAAADGGARAG